MSFGLKNAPTTFQRVIDIILSSVKWKRSLVYLNDKVIFWRTPHEQVDHTRLVLNVLRRAGITFKLEKCAFSTEKIDYLGHVIRPSPLEVASH